MRKMMLINICLISGLLLAAPTFAEEKVAAAKSETEAPATAKEEKMDSKKEKKAAKKEKKADKKEKKADAGKIDKRANGLIVQELKVGTGAEAVSGKTIAAHYTGSLTNGKVFDSSKGNQPIKFQLGAGRVIKGWDEGLVGMKVGGKRKLTIPPDLAYGSRDVGNGLIPANSTLIFEVELMEVE